MAVEWTKEQMKYFIQEYKKLNTPLVWGCVIRSIWISQSSVKKRSKTNFKRYETGRSTVTIKGTTNVTPFEEEFDHSGSGPLGGMWIRVGEVITEDCVVIIDPGYTEVAVLGDIFGQTWHHMGMQGLVCDGPYS